MLLGCVLSFVNLCYYCLSYVFYVFFMLILFGGVHINVRVIFVTIMPLFSFVLLLCQFLLMFIFFCMLLLCKYMCCGIFIHISLFTNSFVFFFEITEDSKKEKVRHKRDLLCHFAFWYELANICVHVFFIHAR